MGVSKVRTSCQPLRISGSILGILCPKISDIKVKSLCLPSFFSPSFISAVGKSMRRWWSGNTNMRHVMTISLQRRGRDEKPRQQNPSCQLQALAPHLCIYADYMRKRKPAEHEVKLKGETDNTKVSIKQILKVACTMRTKAIEKMQTIFSCLQKDT